VSPLKSFAGPEKEDNPSPEGGRGRTLLLSKHTGRVFLLIHLALARKGKGTAFFLSHGNRSPKGGKN